MFVLINLLTFWAEFAMDALVLVMELEKLLQTKEVVSVDLHMYSKTTHAFARPDSSWLRVEDASDAKI